MITDKEVESIYEEVLNKFRILKDKPISIILDNYLLDYDNDTADIIRTKIYKMLSDSISGGEIEITPTDFEIEVNKLYDIFNNSQDITMLLNSTQALKSKMDYFINNTNNQNRLVMPIQNFESVYIELTSIEYGLSYWDQIKDFIKNESSKQVDIQKGLSLEKQTSSTFFYMMDKLGFVKKSTIKNRVYIKLITL